MKAASDSPLRVLFRIFLFRVIDLEVLSAEGDTSKLLGQFAAVFAGISFLFILPLLLTSGQLAEPDMWTMEHLLIATTFTVVGIASVLSWDSLIPDRRDVLILTPLPIPTATLFVAKLAAVGALLALVVASLNIFTGLSWPFLFAAHGGTIAAFRALGAYWLTVTLAAVFAACLVIGLQGVAVQLLPRQLYLRSSAPLQGLTFCAFTGLYFLEPSLETRQALMAPENQAILHWLPAYWFLGVFQQLNGSSFAAFAQLAQRAWSGLTIGMVLAVTALLAAYIRTLPRLVEQPDILPAKLRVLGWPRGLKSAQLAVVIFILRTLLRSRQHRLIASFYLGVGGAAALAYASFAAGSASLPRALRMSETREVVLSTTIVLMCVAVAAIRTLFALPVTLRANWIFRMTQVRNVTEYVRATRCALLLMSVAPTLLCLAAVLFAGWPSRLAVVHLVALALLGGALAEWSLSRFRKVPFTCSYLPGRANGHIVFWVAVLLLIPAANRMAHVEAHLLTSGAGCTLLVVLLAAAWGVGLWRNRRRAIATAVLTFEEMPAPDLFSLKLDRERYAAADMKDSARSM